MVKLWENVGHCRTENSCAFRGHFIRGPGWKRLKPSSVDYDVEGSLGSWMPIFGSRALYWLVSTVRYYSSEFPESAVLKVLLPVPNMVYD